MSRALEVGGLRGELCDRSDLGPGEREKMYQILCDSFEGVDRLAFDADLDEKQRVVLLRDEAGGLQGFSTFLTWEEELGGRRVAVLFSGDTIVARPWWGTPVLHRAWLKGALEARVRVAPLPLYWFLICSGYRTYRFLPAFWSEFWPRHDRPTPPEVQALIDVLATRRYGDRYVDGVVRFDHAARLRSEVGAISALRLRNPHVAHFAALNPRHDEGDELVCLTEISPDNTTRAGARVFRAVESE